IVCRGTQRRKNLSGSGLLFQRLSKLPLRFGELAGPLVESLFEVGRRGSAGAPNGHLLAAGGLCCLSAARPHSYSTHRCARLASGHAAAAPPTRAMNFLRLMVPSNRGLNPTTLLNEKIVHHSKLDCPTSAMGRNEKPPFSAYVSFRQQLRT